jgi:hypothetical protein
MKRSTDRNCRYYFLLISIFIVLIISSCQQADETREYGWFDFIVPDLDTTVTVVDMSFLNSEIAGSSGYITLIDGHFADGRGDRIRFFGDNLTFGSCFPDKETSTALAIRLKRLGMNVMRFHHMDNQSAPGGIWDKDKKALDPGQLDKLDWLIYQLKLNGIYSNINTHVSGNYPGMDYQGLEQFNYGKTIDNFFRPYIEMQKNYAKMLLTHKNPYTGTTYAEEPAVAFVEVNNENSLLSGWYLLPKLNKAHMASLRALWTTWLNSHPDYKKSIGGADIIRIITKYSDGSTPKQKEAMWSFLVDTEMAYAKEMIDYLRNDLKVKALLSETQASYSGVAGVLRESKYADFIDMHSYWEHPSFPGRSWSRTDWRIRNSSMVADKKGGTLLRFGQHRVEGMPFTISEYDHPAPNFFVAEMYPMLNSYSAFQDFDGIYHFDTGFPYGSGKINGFFQTSGHPLKQVFIPAGAVMFRMGAVKPGGHYVRLGLPEESVIGELVKAGDKLKLHVTNMNYIWENAGSVNALTLLHPISVDTKAAELAMSEKVSDPGGAWVSETGEIIWENKDSINAVYKVNAPAARVAVGYIGGKNIELGSVTIRMDETAYNWASISLTSLDGKPVEESSKVLLVAAGRAENTGWKWDEKFTTLGGEWGSAPSRAEGIPAKLIFRDMDKFSVHSLDAAGNKVAEIKVSKKGSDRSFNIGSQHKTLWYILTRN